LSLSIRERLVEASARSIIVPHGLIAHGRGEAFDYLMGEKTTKAATNATRVAAGLLVTARNPVLSVNGNAAALAGKGIVQLASIIPAQIEVNLFHASPERQARIARYLKRLGAKQVLRPRNSRAVTLPGISSPRARVTLEGIGEADVVLIPLEDGDRAEGLRKIGKTVIAIDLNPLSRTSRVASVTIVDNLVRAIPALIKAVHALKKSGSGEIRGLTRSFSNGKNLEDSVSEITNYLQGWRQN
jgi:4-phosphopantoate--beta-alanine ligase